MSDKLEIKQKASVSSTELQLARLSKNCQILASWTADYASKKNQELSEALGEAAGSDGAHDAGKSADIPRRAAIVGWDLGHNPVGRAYVLYKLLQDNWEVDLVGPMWSRYGSELWKPLQQLGLNVRSFQCESLIDFVPAAGIMAAAKTYDLVYVSKPRLPAMYMGSLIKKHSHCPMIVDVDDFELSFFKDETYAEFAEIESDAANALHEPYEELGTRYCQSLVSAADAVTVSNIALQRKFGGNIIRHARDNEDLDLVLERRAKTRSDLGIQDNEFALMFIGTPRPHKGVLEIAKALQELNDPDIVFHIFGSISDKKFEKTLLDCSPARVVLHPDCQFDQLPTILSAADLVPLIQSSTHAISQYQIPAKISDALALGIPVIASRTPPIEDLIIQGAVIPVEENMLAEAILQQKQKFIAKLHIRADLQSKFQHELSVDVNKARLNQIIDGFKDTHNELSTEHQELQDLVLREYQRALNRPNGHQKHKSTVVSIDSAKSVLEKKKTENHNTGVNIIPVLGKLTNLFKAKKQALESSKTAQGQNNSGHKNSSEKNDLSNDDRLNIVFFWKQNDSGIYGRRADMVTKYLAANPRVGKVLHFDAPVKIKSMEHMFRGTVGSASNKLGKKNNKQSHNKYILQNLFDRHMGFASEQGIERFTYIYREDDCTSSSDSFMDQTTGAIEDYSSFIKEKLKESGLRPENTIAWLCPAISDAPAFLNRIEFGAVISDLIDDQRAWIHDPDTLSRLNQNYKETLKLSDVVMANCDSLARAMSEYCADINVVPNGAERLLQKGDFEVPEAISTLKRPVAGYVGNLRDRIDWILLHDVVKALPDVDFVFVGPADNNDNVKSLAKHENVSFTGVVPYDDVHRYMRSFDVGLVPHIHNNLTESMNPLKVYNYFAAGLPIVSSDIGNLEDLGPALTVAGTTDEFVAGIQHSLNNKIDTSDEWWEEKMSGISWDNRVSTMLDIVERSLRVNHSKSA